MRVGEERGRREGKKRGRREGEEREKVRERSIKGGIQGVGDLVECKGNNLLVGCHYSQSFGGHSQIPYLQVRKRG
jgi:hypothetical protein